MASLLDIFNVSVETKPKVDLLVSDFRPLCTDITVARLATYLDLDIEKGPWLAGGAVRKFYLGQNIENSDLDIWFANLAQFEQAKEKIIALGASEAFASDNAVSYKFYEGYDCYNIQLIKRRFFEAPESIISEFDFTVCQLVTDGRKLITGDNTIQDLKTRTLRLVQARLPEYIIPRVVKYIVYGYRPCLDLLEDIDNNISTINWLKQQNDYEAV
jgi:hypothetical protein